MRTTARRLALPAAALAATLALTACGQSSDQDATAPAPAKPAPTTATASAAPTTAAPTPIAARPTTAPRTTTPPTTAPATGTPRETTARPAKPSSPAPTATPRTTTPRPRPCTAADVKVVASRVSRPLNHLALTVTNTGTRTCDAVGAPLVGFDHSQAPIRIVEESRPQAVVTLAPGESAYASVILTGEPGADTHGMTVRTIKVNLTADSMVTVTAPQGTYVDDGAAVSYWQREFEDALQF
ncbi:DUF4232 domain-containing protein [Streptomyces sp. NRRL F-5727]|uniref:DUF4232 domain-containing protein n=1 Tax=Streptomyces sp. NRRL F-5727 TaxID=1463871 RepID=UPI0004CA8C45|nr:DUF4232 domain-containing protein [Streptomyces sp. NRRL F-5727]